MVRSEGESNTKKTRRRCAGLRMLISRVTKTVPCSTGSKRESKIQRPIGFTHPVDCLASIVGHKDFIAALSKRARYAFAIFFRSRKLKLSRVPRRPDTFHQAVGKDWPASLESNSSNMSAADAWGFASWPLLSTSKSGAGFGCSKRGVGSSGRISHRQGRFLEGRVRRRELDRAVTFRATNAKGAGWHLRFIDLQS